MKKYLWKSRFFHKFSQLFSDGGPDAGFVVAWGSGRCAPEASAGMGRDSEKALTFRGGRREALVPRPLQEEISAS